MKWLLVIALCLLFTAIPTAGRDADPQVADLPSRALTAFEAGDYRQAASLYETFAKDFPTDKRAPGALMRAGDCLVKIKDYDQAIAILKHLKAAYPSSPYIPQADYKIPYTFIGKGKTFSGVLSCFPQDMADPKMRMKVGRAYQRKASGSKVESEITLNFNEALAAFKSVVKDFPKAECTPEAAMRIGDCLSNMRQSENALAAWQHFVVEYPSSLLGEHVVKKASNLCSSTDGVDAAIVFLKEIVAKASKKPIAMHAQLQIGLLTVQKYRTTRSREDKVSLRIQAERAFRVLQEQFPSQHNKCAEAELNCIGLAFDRACEGGLTWENVENRISADLKKYENTAPSIKIRFRLWLAECAWRRKVLPIALERVEAAIRECPQCTKELINARMLAGKISSDLGNYVKAVAYFDLVSHGKYTEENLSTPSSQILFRTSWLEMAECYERLGDHVKAETALRELIARYPNTMEAYRAEDLLSTHVHSGIKVDR